MSTKLSTGESSTIILNQASSLTLMVNFNGILLSVDEAEASSVFFLPAIPTSTGWLSFSSGSSLFTVADKLFRSPTDFVERLLGDFSIGILEPIAEVVEDNSDVVKAVDVSLIFPFLADKLFTGSSFVLFYFCLDSVGIDSVESLLNL